MRLVWLILALSAVASCQSYRYQTLLEKNVIESEVFSSPPYQLRVLRPVATQLATAKLHVYIEGDGRPWRNSQLVAPDPTAHSALMLDAMLVDSAPRLYLGRPCYLHTQDPACSAMDWTMARYSDAVVSSMTNIVDNLADGVPELWLIGHSGGGTLAVLIGRRLGRPVNVLTIAANLDHRAWTNHHGYTPLAESLNPVDESNRNPRMRALHWYGRRDRNVLPAWTLAYCQRQGVDCRQTEASHARGWLPYWQDMLSEAAAYFENR